MRAETRALINVAADGNAKKAAALRARLVEGETLRAAAARSGVSKSTLARLEQRVRRAQG